MTARIPYLTALARKPSAQPVLRPPRRLFAEQAPPVQADWTKLAPAVEPPVATPRPPVLARTDPGRPGPAPERPPAGDASTRKEPTAPSLAPAQDQQPMPSPPADRRLAPPEPDTPAPGLAAPRQAPAPAPAPDEHPSPSQPEMPSLAAASRPPESWTDPRWGQPVEIPQAPRHKESGAVPSPEASPAPRVPDLRPPPATVSGSAIEPASPDLGAGRHRPPGDRPAQVSIGTIEVTVVPPAPPAAPPRPERRDRVSPTPAASSADRLRDGLRRWHGTAQG